MKLFDLVRKDCIRVPLQHADKTASISELVDCLKTAGVVRDSQLVLRAVLTREARGSTCIGAGLAVPHAKSEASPTLSIAIGKPPVPFDFGGYDGQPCRLIVLLVGPPDAAGPHIQILAAISRLWLLPQFRTDVLDAQTPEAIFDLLAQC